ncbi:unnamed protein product, partial [marine sediment metagenome]
VAQISGDSTAYTDSIRWDSISSVTGKLYNKATPPSLLSNIFSFENKMFGIQGSNLYWSRLDTAAAWGAFDFVSLNRSDGDHNTVAYPARGVVRVHKNKSNFNVYQDANLNWNRREISGQFGCIAPQSHSAGLFGHYFLSENGVLRESEGQYLERTQQIKLVSAQLDNFDALPLTTKAKAKSFYFDQKYMLSIGDTTYVYDERADAWTTWDFTFQDATYYGVEDVLGFYPGDTMYFIKPGDSLLYRYGSSELDGNDTIA